MCNTPGPLALRLQWLQTGLERKVGSGDFAATLANQIEISKAYTRFETDLAGLIELIERKPRLAERYASLLNFMRLLRDREVAANHTPAATS